MTEFLKKSFSSRAATDNYRDGWDAIFGKKKWEEDTKQDRETLPELPEVEGYIPINTNALKISPNLRPVYESEFGINECPPAPKEHFFGPQTDGTYTMKAGISRTTFRVERTQTNGYQPKVYRYWENALYTQDRQADELELITIVTYCSSDGFRAWLEEQLAKG